jgi:tetratricopeptide (TPR) repeat protein
MAEEIIVIEDEKEQEPKKKKFIFLIVIVLLLIIILLVILLFVVIKKKKEPLVDDKEIVKITKKLEKKNVSKDEIKELIKKANILYQKGEKKRALLILNKLSSYSEALSYYNLGVIKLKEKNYKKALEFFQKAISNKDNRLLSAINATYAALMLNNKKLFNYYRHLAYVFLPEMSKSKSYPYYYALVMYYMGYEFEAIKALNIDNPYKQKSKELLSAIYAYYNKFAKAQELTENPFFKGLSLAEIGEYSLARIYLKKSHLQKAKFALALIDLKLSYFKEAGRILSNAKNLYPITVFLKDSLFDIKVTQKEFKQEFLKTNKDFYDLFFYFAPYKVFNLNQTINFLRKGIAGIPIGSITQSQQYLYKSATYSALNLEISKALKLAIDGHIILANKAFKKLLKKKPTSYILHYNLALTYAQLGDYNNAYKHFLRAYHLNPKDIYSGIFALMSLDKMDKSNKYLLASVKEDINAKDSIFLAIIDNNTVEMARFLEKETSKPLLLIAKIASKMILNKDVSFEAEKLKSMYSKDIVANLLYFYANNINLPIHKLALNFQSLFFQHPWNMNYFYYGAFIASDWLFKFSKISGLLNQLRFEIRQKAKEENFDLIPVLQKLAFVDLYTKHFEESYVIYNDLINNKKITDSATLYNAAVAAIGANHHANAVALMELAKLKNPNYYEARYGLGLLWQEANNLRAASIQYLKIPDGFKSRFFDFNVNRPALK